MRPRCWEPCERSSQLELVGEALRATLNVLATVAPDWLMEQVPPDWYERYAQRIEDSRLPKDKREREALSQRIGDDGYDLLARVEQAAQQGLEWLQLVPAIQLLEQIWAQQYRMSDGHARRLTPQEHLPVGEWLRSPDDRDGRDGRHGRVSRPGALRQGRRPRRAVPSAQLRMRRDAV